MWIILLLWMFPYINGRILSLEAYNQTVADLDSRAFFPFGPTLDAIITGDDNTAYININFFLPIFGSQFNRLYVSTNGLVSTVSYNTYVPIRLPTSTRFVAAFWADAVAGYSGAGNVYYRQTSETSALNKATSEVRSTQIGSLFTASWALIATWHNVKLYGSTQHSWQNTFQMVIATDGQDTWMILNYDKLEWFGTSSSRAALAGYNSGGEDYYQIDGSLTTDVVELVNTSNVNIPGKWILSVNVSTSTDSETTFLEEATSLIYPSSTTDQYDSETSTTEQYDSAATPSYEIMETTEVTSFMPHMSTTAEVHSTMVTNSPTITPPSHTCKAESNITYCRELTKNTCNNNTWTFSVNIENQPDLTRIKLKLQNYSSQQTYTQDILESSVPYQKLFTNSCCIDKIVIEAYDGYYRKLSSCQVTWKVPYVLLLTLTVPSQIIYTRLLLLGTVFVVMAIGHGLAIFKQRLVTAKINKIREMLLK